MIELLHLFALTPGVGPAKFGAEAADFAEVVVVMATIAALPNASAGLSKMMKGGGGKLYSSAQGFLSKGQQHKVKENVGKMSSGDRFKGSNALARGFNTTTQGAAMGWEGRFGVGRRGRAMRELRTRQAATAAAKDPLLQEGQYDDDGIAALYLSAGQSGRLARRELRRLHMHDRNDGRGMRWDDGWDAQRVERAVSSAEAMGITRSNAIAAGNLAADNKFRSLGFGVESSDAVAQTNARLAGGQLDSQGNFIGGNRQLYDNLEGGVRYHARTHGATHMAWKTLEDSWDKTNMSELNASAPDSKAAFMDMIGRGLQSNDADVRARASVRALEMHTLLSHGTDAKSQEEILAFENSIGYGDAQRGGSFENFLATRGAGTLTDGAAIRARARTYDAQDLNPAARSGGP